MILYHGSNHVIDKFVDEFVGKGNDELGPGIYFAEKIDVAYAHGRFIYKVDIGPYKSPSFAKKCNPARVMMLAKKAPEWEDNAQNWAQDPEKGVERFARDISHQSEADAFESVWYDFYRHEPVLYVRNMVAMGYGGFNKQWHDGIVHVIFDPSLIRLVSVEDAQAGQDIKENKQIKNIKKQKSMCKEEKSCGCGCPLAARLTESQRIDRVVHEISHLREEAKVIRMATGSRIDFELFVEDLTAACEELEPGYGQSVVDRYWVAVEAFHDRLEADGVLQGSTPYDRDLDRIAAVMMTGDDSRQAVNEVDMGLETTTLRSFVRAVQDIVGGEATRGYRAAIAQLYDEATDDGAQRGTELWDQWVSRAAGAVQRMEEDRHSLAVNEVETPTIDHPQTPSLTNITEGGGPASAAEKENNIKHKDTMKDEEINEGINDESQSSLANPHNSQGEDGGNSDDGTTGWSSTIGLEGNAGPSGNSTQDSGPMKLSTKGEQSDHTWDALEEELRLGHDLDGSDETGNSDSDDSGWSQPGGPGDSSMLGAMAANNTKNNKEATHPPKGDRKATNPPHSTSDNTFIGESESPEASENTDEGQIEPVREESNPRKRRRRLGGAGIGWAGTYPGAQTGAEEQGESADDEEDEGDGGSDEGSIGESRKARKGLTPLGKGGKKGKKEGENGGVGSGDLSTHPSGSGSIFEKLSFSDPRAIFPGGLDENNQVKRKRLFPESYGIAPGEIAGGQAVTSPGSGGSSVSQELEKGDVSSDLDENNQVKQNDISRETLSEGIALSIRQGRSHGLTINDMMDDLSAIISAVERLNDSDGLDRRLAGEVRNALDTFLSYRQGNARLVDPYAAIEGRVREAMDLVEPGANFELVLELLNGAMVSLDEHYCSLTEDIDLGIRGAAHHSGTIEGMAEDLDRIIAVASRLGDGCSREDLRDVKEALDRFEEYRANGDDVARGEYYHIDRLIMAAKAHLYAGNWRGLMSMLGEVKAFLDEIFDWTPDRFNEARLPLEARGFKDPSVAGLIGDVATLAAFCHGDLRRDSSPEEFAIVADGLDALAVYSYLPEYRDVLPLIQSASVMCGSRNVIALRRGLDAVVGQLEGVGQLTESFGRLDEGSGSYFATMTARDATVLRGVDVNGKPQQMWFDKGDEARWDYSQERDMWDVQNPDGRTVYTIRLANDAEVVSSALSKFWVYNVALRRMLEIASGTALTESVVGAGTGDQDYFVAKEKCVVGGIPFQAGEGALISRQSGNGGSSYRVFKVTENDNGSFEEVERTSIPCHEYTEPAWVDLFDRVKGRVPLSEDIRSRVFFHMYYRCVRDCQVGGMTFSAGDDALIKRVSTSNYHTAYRVYKVVVSADGGLEELGDEIVTAEDRKNWQGCFEKVTEESLSLNESARVDLGITSNQKRELIKQAKCALDCVYAIYAIQERGGIKNSKFEDYLGDSFESLNELLIILVKQQSVERDPE